MSTEEHILLMLALRSKKDKEKKDPMDEYFKGINLNQEIDFNLYKEK